MWPMRSAQLSGPTEIFYITPIQKLRILTQKKHTPPPKKGLFLGGGEITRPLNPGITWADNLIQTRQYKKKKKKLIRFKKRVW